MNKAFIFISSLLFILFSCDALVQLNYSVKNDTKDTLRIHVQHYPTNPGKLAYLSEKDTILTILPNERVWVGASPVELNFPWGSKSIYRKCPGVCEIELLQNDSIIPLPCDKEHWNYKRKISTLKIK